MILAKRAKKIKALHKEMQEEISCIILLYALIFRCENSAQQSLTEFPQGTYL